MDEPVEIDRRAFYQLTTAAFLGMVAGAANDAAAQEKKAAPAKPSVPPPPGTAPVQTAKPAVPAQTTKPAVPAQTVKPAVPAQPAKPAAPGAKPKVKPVNRGNPLLLEPNICRGLNVCKGKGKGDGFGGPNKCVGMSICATVAAHTCNGNNDCRGQGACDVGDPAIYAVGYPGENTCEGKGACGVPITANKEHVWKQARRRFEALLKDAGGQAGPAPARR